MKRYWPFMGAVGIAATVGLCTYVSRDPLYEEPETEEFLEDEPEHEAELHDDKIPVPYDSQSPAAKEKKQIKEKPNSPKYRKKEEKPPKLPSQPSSPKSSDLENAVEDAQEFPSYYIPPEERDYSKEEFRKGFFGAIRAREYKVAETYFADVQKYFNTQDQEYIKAVKNFLLCQIAVDYHDYLSDVIKCREQDAYSVLRKVIWMDSFLNQYKDDLITRCTTRDGIEKNPPGYSEYSIEITADYLKQKGEKALEKVINCPKDEKKNE